MTQLLFFLLAVGEGENLIIGSLPSCLGLLKSIFNLVDFTQNWYIFKDSIKEEVLKQWSLDVEERESSKTCELESNEIENFVGKIENWSQSREKAFLSQK